MKDQQSANKRRAKEAEKVWTERKPEIERLYHGRLWTQKKLARHYGISQSAMHKVMQRLGMQARSTANHGERNGRFKDGSQSTMYRQMIDKDKCSACGSLTRLVIHHKNGCHTDNRLDNLQVLCESCHNRLTMTIRWGKNARSG